MLRSKLFNVTGPNLIFNLKSLPSLVFVSFLSIASLANSASSTNPDLLVLEHIAASVDQLSSQLVAMQGANQQNWQNYFTLKANVKFSAQDYPEWQNLQSQFSTMQGALSPSALNTLLPQASQYIFNPDLTKYSTNLDQVSLSMASGAVNQVNQANQSANAITKAVSMPLGTPWQQELSTANQLQVLKAMSAQMSVNNALMYNLWQQSQAQQLLLSRLLVELTQLNQTVSQLSSIAINTKSK